LTIPTELNHYKILEPLGKGGMGEVFAAEDTRLHRRVAIKVLSGLMASDVERRQRFEREAQAIAALNHPNIVTIHAVEEAAGVPFIVMELVDGRPLSDLIKAGGLPLDTLLRIGVAVSDAIGAAHQRGITHRDLKPANVMVGSDSRVKVLDFGLAKLREAEAAYDGETRLPAGDLTGEGRILGTVAYMSPEQAEGKPVDQRSDIFSLGVMLHEMAVGERPFQGETNVSIISSILKDTPSSITDLNPGLPPGLARIIRHALSKDPSRRYQTAIDLRNELEELKQEVDSGVTTMTSAIPRRAPERRSRRSLLAIGGGALAVAAVAVAFYAWSHRPAPRAMDFVPDRFARLTTSGAVRLAAISGDGRYVVHIKDEGLNPSLWIRQTAAMSDVQIVPSALVRYDGLAFAPDGNYIYYSTYELTGGVATLYRIPVLGGTPERVLEDIDSRVSFSPDRRQFAFVRGVPQSGENDLMIASADGSNARPLGRAGGSARPLAAGGGPTQLALEAPAWSPDGSTIVVAARSLEDGPHSLYLAFDARTGDSHPIGGRWAGASDCAWLPDGGSFLVVAADFAAPQSPQLWQISYPSGERRRVTLDLNNYVSVTVSADGASVATVQSEVDSTLSVASPPDLLKGVPIASGRGRADGLQGLAWTGNGRLVYSSNSSGSPQIWIADTDGANARQLTNGHGLATAPTCPVTGWFVVYQQFRDNSIHVYRTGLDGADTRQLTDGQGEFNPIVSPDGKRVYFTSFVSGQGRVMKVSTDGGKPTVFDAAFGPLAVSPDGTRLLGTAWDAANRRSSLALLPATGGALELLNLPVVGAPAWAPDGKSIIYLDFADGQLVMLSRDLERATSRTIQRFPSDRTLAFAWSRDGQKVALARGTFSSDVVIISRK
jgi:Tol biopolymer transport system component